MEYEHRQGRAPIDRRYVRDFPGDIESPPKVIEIKATATSFRGWFLPLEPIQFEHAQTDPDFYLYVVENVGQGDPAKFTLRILAGDQLRDMTTRAAERHYFEVSWPTREYDATRILTMSGAGEITRKEPVIRASSPRTLRTATGQMRRRPARRSVRRWKPSVGRPRPRRSRLGSRRAIRGGGRTSPWPWPISRTPDLPRRRTRPSGAFSSAWPRAGIACVRKGGSREPSDRPNGEGSQRALSRIRTRKRPAVEPRGPTVASRASTPAGIHRHRRSATSDGRPNEPLVGLRRSRRAGKPGGGGHRPSRCR